MRSKTFVRLAIAMLVVGFGTSSLTLFRVRQAYQYATTELLECRQQLEDLRADVKVDFKQEQLRAQSGVYLLEDDLCEVVPPEPKKAPELISHLHSIVEVQGCCDTPLP